MGLGQVVAWLRQLTPAGIMPSALTQLDALGFEWDEMPLDAIPEGMELLAAEFPNAPADDVRGAEDVTVAAQPLGHRLATAGRQA